MAGTYKSRKRERAGQNAIFVQWAILYTIVFVPIAMLVWSPFYREERSLIWGYDGLYQTYTTMVYYSNYWRTFFKNLFSGKFVLPMVDTSVGLGFDVFTSLNHYGFGDPLEILSIFFTEKNMEVCYNFLALLRYYLSGLAFGAYGLYMGRKQIPVLAGAFAYAFCGFALYAGVRHPYFMNSMIYFPLLCVGAEQILRKKQGWLLAVMTGIAACSNFYFLYMLTILTFLYAIVRFAALYGGKWKQEIRGRLLAGCGWYLLGIGLGSVFLIPNILAFFGNARGGIAAGFENTWFAYPAEFYKEMVIGCFFPEYSARYWCVLGYPPLLLLGLLFLLRRKADKKEQWLGVWFLILSLILWIPLGGYLMNGLSYVSHRWMYGYSFCAALILVYGVEKLHTVTAKEMFCYTGILSALGLLYRVNVDRKSVV